MTSEAVFNDNYDVDYYDEKYLFKNLIQYIIPTGFDGVGIIYFYQYHVPNGTGLD